MRLKALLIGTLVAAAAVGCGGPKPDDAASGSPAAPDAATKGTIGLSVLTSTNPFFKVIADSMAAEAKKSGYDVIVVSGDNDVARQQNQVKDFIVQKCSVIVLNPCDSRAIGEAIKEANAAGIPVFTSDIACLAEDAKVVCHIATDNFQGGKLAAKALIEALDGKGKVAIIDYPDVESVLLRTKGFHEALEEARANDGVTIEVVATLPGGGAKDISRNAAQDLLQAHPDINGIFAINDPSALGVVAALEEAGKSDQVVVVGFDGQPEGKRAILDGDIYADPIQFPARIGIETVHAIMKYLDGEEVPKEILIPTELYKKEDTEKDPEING